MCIHLGIAGNTVININYNINIVYRKNSTILPTYLVIIANNKLWLLIYFLMISFFFCTLSKNGVLTYGFLYVVVIVQHKKKCYHDLKKHARLHDSTPSLGFC